jgi:molecular chaperone DnaK
LGKTLGIDLGTTNSAMSSTIGGEPTVIANAEGHRTTPSVVGFAKGTGEVVVGELARRQAVTNLTRTIASVKRHMGDKWTTEEIDGKRYTPQEISARILMKLKRDAEAYLNEDIDGVVITCPAYYNDAQRQAVKEAGEVAGLKVLRIINEPTAAALAYGLEKGAEDELILVWDLGGGTFDVSLLEVAKDEDGFSTVQVIGTSGDNKLGGDDWDISLRAYILEEFKKANNGYDLSTDAAAMQRVKDAAEQAKKDLSATSETTVALPYIAVTADGPLNLEVTVTRHKFEEITKDLLNRQRKPFEQVLADAKRTVKDIHQVVLVGGSTRMPAVEALAKELTGREPNKSVNPDEVVALGAAVQAAIVTGERKDVLLIDVTPLDLGIEVSGGLMERLIERNTAIPSQAKQTFTTAVDNQRAVTVQVFQGPREFTKDNHKLGQFDLKVAPAPAGRPQIEVIFDIDANGLVNVKAKDVGTGVEQSIVISGSNNLSDADIERMISEAAANEETDRNRREVIEIRNAVTGVIASAHETLDEYGDKISASLRDEVSANIKALETEAASETATKASIEAAGETLNASLTKIGEELYKTPEPTPEATETNDASPADSEPASADANEEDIIDAEVVED